jgi:GT2 family glycosyltransferase
MTLPKVVLLILTWNRRDDVLRCVASLSRLTYPRYVPVVIDNASRDGTVAALRARFPDLTILVNETNRGYAGGNNVGIRWALAHGADYVLIMNNDTEVTPHMVTAMVEVAESDARIAVVGCRNLLMEDPSRLWAAYGVLTYGPFVVRGVGCRAVDGPAWQTVKDVDCVVGNGYLWRAAALEHVGLLDERFFAYHEDADWCLRARRAGYRVVYAGTSAILHKGASSSGSPQNGSALMYYLLGRNGVLFARKNATPSERIRFAFACGGAWGLRAVRALALSLLPGGARKSQAVRLRAMEGAFLRGIADALRGRPIPFRALGLTDAEGGGRAHESAALVLEKPLTPAK